jgi:hypothetical protein
VIPPEDNDLSDLEGSIRTYFEEISLNEGISSENMITNYFDYYTNVEKVSFEKILEKNPKYVINYDKDPTINFINEENRLVHFAHMKVKEV